MRLLTSLLLVLLAGLAASQPFGRFGYRHFPEPPGFVIDADGFKAQHPAADKICFRTQLPELKVKNVSERLATYKGVRYAGNPEVVRVNLRSPGFELFYPLGVEFRVGSLQAPYLSWSDGSVGEGVPTPPVKWVLVSFHDRQPPILIVFKDYALGLKVTGQPGEWRIKGTEHYEGWIRVCLPLGLKAFPANSAASLGEAVAETQKNIDFWTGKTPDLIDVTVRADESGVTAVWRFDRPGAVIPPALLLAKQGGYLAQPLSGVALTSFGLLEGPIGYSTEPKLAVRFPSRRVPVGRALGIGKVTRPPIKTPAASDLPKVVELALSMLLASRKLDAEADAERLLQGYIVSTKYESEPFTAQRLPYDAEGRGIDLVAAHGLLMQCISTAKGDEKEPNSLLTSVAWRRDWMTWLPWVKDKALSRRVAGLAAVAGALSGKPDLRLDAAMFQTGLAADDALADYRKANGLPEDATSNASPLNSIRRALFSLDGKPVIDPFAQLLLSRIRVAGPYDAILEPTEEGLLLRWTFRAGDPQTILLFTGLPIKAEPFENLAGCSAKESLGTMVIRFRPRRDGRCSVKLSVPDWSAKLPVLIAPLAYSEVP